MTRTRWAQAGAAFCALAAGGVLVAPAQWWADDQAPTLTPFQPRPPVPRPTPGASIESPAFLKSLAAVSPDVGREQPPPPPAPPEGDLAAAANEPPPPPPPPPWRFIGSVVGPGIRRAIVVEGEKGAEKQRLLREGDKVFAVTIEKIDPDVLTVLENGERRQVRLAPRQLPVVVRDATPAPARNPRMLASVGGEPQPVRPPFTFEIPPSLRRPPPGSIDLNEHLNFGGVLNEQQQRAFAELQEEELQRGRAFDAAERAKRLGIPYEPNPRKQAEQRGLWAKILDDMDARRAAGENVPEIAPEIMEQMEIPPP